MFLLLSTSRQARSDEGVRGLDLPISLSMNEMRHRYPVGIVENSPVIYRWVGGQKIVASDVLPVY